MVKVVVFVGSFLARMLDDNETMTVRRSSRSWRGRRRLILLLFDGVVATAILFPSTSLPTSSASCFSSSFCFSSFCVFFSCSYFFLLLWSFFWFQRSGVPVPPLISGPWLLRVLFQLHCSSLCSSSSLRFSSVSFSFWPLLSSSFYCRSWDFSKAELWSCLWLVVAWCRSFWNAGWYSSFRSRNEREDLWEHSSKKNSVALIILAGSVCECTRSHCKIADFVTGRSIRLSWCASPLSSITPCLSVSLSDIRWISPFPPRWPSLSASCFFDDLVSFFSFLTHTLIRSCWDPSSPLLPWHPVGQSEHAACLVQTQTWWSWRHALVQWSVNEWENLCIERVWINVAIRSLLLASSFFFLSS